MDFTQSHAYSLHEYFIGGSLGGHIKIWDEHQADLRRLLYNLLSSTQIHILQVNWRS